MNWKVTEEQQENSKLKAVNKQIFAQLGYKRNNYSKIH